jgi:hypothetical protein
MAAFPFTDLHSFKDYVVFVRMCAPDNFPLREGLRKEDQWSLNLAFEGLRKGLSYLQAGSHSSEKCFELFGEAHRSYLAHDRKGGFTKLQEVERLLRNIPSQ